MRDTTLNSFIVNRETTVRVNKRMTAMFLKLSLNTTITFRNERNIVGVTALTYLASVTVISTRSVVSATVASRLVWLASTIVTTGGRDASVVTWWVWNNWIQPQPGGRTESGVSIFLKVFNVCVFQVCTYETSMVKRREVITTVVKVFFNMKLLLLNNDLYALGFECVLAVSLSLFGIRGESKSSAGSLWSTGVNASNTQSNHGTTKT
jgi:hypothetical protein